MLSVFRANQFRSASAVSTQSSNRDPSHCRTSSSAMALSLRCLAQASKSLTQAVSPVSPRTLQVPKTPKTPKTPRTPITPMTLQRQPQPFGLPEEAVKRIPKSPKPQRSVHFDEPSTLPGRQEVSEAAQLPLKNGYEASDTCVPTPSLAEFRTNLPVLLGRLRVEDAVTESTGPESSALAAQRAFLARQSRRASRAQREFVV